MLVEEGGTEAGGSGITGGVVVVEGEDGMVGEEWMGAQNSMMDAAQRMSRALVAVS